MADPPEFGDNFDPAEKHFPQDPQPCGCHFRVGGPFGGSRINGSVWGTFMCQDDPGLNWWRVRDLLKPRLEYLLTLFNRHHKLEVDVVRTYAPDDKVPYHIGELYFSWVMRPEIATLNVDPRVLLEARRGTSALLRVCNIGGLRLLGLNTAENCVKLQC